MNYRVKITLFFIVIIIFGLNINYNFKENEKIKKYDGQQANSLGKSKPEIANFWELNFIHVNNNWTSTNSSNLWCNGKGTKENPYIIENATINGNGIGSGIFIENSRDYFEIRNSTISNVEYGIKIINTTNFRFKNITIFNIYGRNAVNGVLGKDGPNAEICSGIYIENCSNTEILTTKIYNLSGGRGGNGGSGGLGSVGCAAGKGSDTYGINIFNSCNILISTSEIFDIKSGDGGHGGDGANGDINTNIHGSNGGSGGSGGNAYGIFINNSNKITIENNTIYKISSGMGGSGGRGGDGHKGYPLNDGGFGGQGGTGGNGGFLGGIYLINVISTSIHYNRMFNNTCGNGGNGGDGGWGGEGGDGLSYQFPGGDGGNGGWGGNGGNSGSCFILYFTNCLGLNNSFNFLANCSNGSYGIGGNRGIGGLGGSYGSDGYDGQDGAFGVINPIIGFNLYETSNSKSFYNIIFIKNNCDNGNNNLWDNEKVGNYWSYYQGIDVNPLDGIGDTNYTLEGITNVNDTKPILYPLIYPIYSDFDADKVGNLEEFILGFDGYITNASNPDTDFDGLNDYWEWINNTNPLNNDTDGDLFKDGIEIELNTDPKNFWCYPMPNLKIIDFKDIVTYENSSFSLDFSIQNNGIWKAENVIIIIHCQSENLILYNNSNSLINLDVDETIRITESCLLINKTGEYIIELIIDQINIVNETYSNKDGSLNFNCEYDNYQQATLTILSDYQPNQIIIIEPDGKNDKDKEIKNDEVLIITLSIFSTYSIIASIGIAFLLKKIKSEKKLAKVPREKKSGK